MNSPTAPIATAALGLAALAGGIALHGTTTTATAQDAEVGPAGGVGVVDFARIQRESAYVQGLRQQLEADAGEQNQQLQQEQNRIRQAVQDLQALAEGSEQRQTRERELAEQNAVLQFRQQAAQQQTNQSLNEANFAFYESVEEAVQAIARERGLAVVIRKASQPMPEGDDLARVIRGMASAEASNLIQGQTTLYVDPGADITGEVIAKIDADNQPAGNGE